MKTVEFHDALPLPEFLAQLREYLLRKTLPLWLLTPVLPALAFALLAADLVPAGYWTCAGVLYVVLFAVPLWLFLYPQFRHLTRYQCRTYHPEYAYRFDYEAQTLTVTTATVTECVHFSLLTRLRRRGGFVWLERGNALTFCIREKAFPTPEALEEWVKFLRHTIRHPRQPQLETLPHQLPRVSPWKSCFIGCGIVFLVVAVLLGIGIYRNVLPWFIVPELREYRLTAPERSDLDNAVARLQQQLREKAPALAARHRPLPESTRRFLREQLGGVVVEPLEVWLEFSNGLNEQEIMPLGEPMDITAAAGLFLISRQPWFRGLSPERADCLMLLHDGAGDGYFLKLAGDAPEVYYDMQEVPGDAFRLGNLTDFLNFLADGLEQGIWTFDDNGHIHYDMENFLNFQERYIKQAENYFAPSQPFR